MVAVLRLDSDGVVDEASPGAAELLGPCIGRRCCDVVLARASDRTLRCTPGCGVRTGAESTRDQRGVTVRERPCRLVCTDLGDGRVVIVLSDRADRVHGVSLSPRERAVLSLVAAGHPDADIAEALSIAPSTVKTLLRRARSKLGAQTRAEAVAVALRSGLID